VIDVVTSLLAFIVAIGVMVTVHEFGHYWVARRCNVRVLRFSVGFGKPLWRRELGADRTEFVVAAIPLGGYVKMLDEREGEVAESEAHRAFNRQPVGSRAAIVAAGPAINFVLALFAYWLMFMIGVSGLTPLVGGVQENSPAAEAGFERGEQIRAIGNRATPTWSDVRISLIDVGLDDAAPPVRVRVQTVDGETRERTLAVASVSLRKGEEDPVGKLGLDYWLPELPARISDVQPDSPAANAGLRSGDRVVRADGNDIADWHDWVRYVRERPEEEIRVEVERGGSIVNLRLSPARTEAGIGQIGAYGPVPDAAERERMFTTVRYGPLTAASEGAVKTWEITRLTVRVVTRLVTGEAALSNISGPVTIAHYAGESARIGLAQFLGFLALISISIGILNLLPIPILDGGHLLYFLIEAIKGSPVSERAQMIGHQIGIVMLFGLMALALYNDFLRLVS